MTPLHDHAHPPVIPLAQADAGETLTLQRAAYVSEARLHDDLSPPPLTESLEAVRVELARPDLQAWGVREDGRLVAAVRVLLRGPAADLGRLAVAPDRQGTLYARAPVRARLLEHAQRTRGPRSRSCAGLHRDTAPSMRRHHGR